MTRETVEEYIVEELNSEPRHDLDGLAFAIHEVADLSGLDEIDLMKLLLANKPIEGEYTHSYGFQTYVGRGLVELMQALYNGYEREN